MSRHRCAFPLLVAIAAGCGQLDTPDLQHGTVTGVIAGATTGARAYVLGSPEIQAQAGPDGTFRLDGLAAGESRVVMFDGSLGAEIAPVEVRGASISHVELGRPLKPAAEILVVPSPLGGTLPTGLVVTIDGTPLRQGSEEGGAARLFPVPAGSFVVAANQPGFREARIQVQVGEGQSRAVEVALDVAIDDERRGCLSCGCDHGLACDAADGRCYACVADSDCATGGRCTAMHSCSYGGGTARSCEPCTATLDCEGAGAVCVGAGPALGGYCSQTCSAGEGCPAGFECHDGACTVLMSCQQIAITFGATCTQDESCAAALGGGTCMRSGHSSGPGYCTATVQDGCPSGFVPDPAGSGYCAKGRGM